MHEPNHLVLIVVSYSMYSILCLHININLLVFSHAVDMLASSDAATQQLKPLNRQPEYLDLLNKVAAHTRDKWWIMGIQLNIPTDQLNSMTATDPISCYADVFNWWQRNGSPPYTWATIIDALRAPIVGEVQLAHELEEWLTTVQAPAAAIPTFGMLLSHVI